MSPAYFMGCGCQWSHTFALWDFRDGVRVGLCRPHLDMWLDNADDDPDMEPASLKFHQRHQESRMNEGETLLTERQWRVRQCNRFGHRITILEADGEPVQLTCDDCGRSWQIVRQPLSTVQNGQPQP